MKKLSLLATMLCCAAALFFTSCKDAADGNEMSNDEVQRVFNEMQGTYTGVLYTSRDTTKHYLQCEIDSLIKIQNFPDALLEQATSNKTLRQILYNTDATRELWMPIKFGGWYDSQKSVSYFYLFPESIIKENLILDDTNRKVTFAFYSGIDSPGLFNRSNRSIHLEFTVGGVFFDDELQYNSTLRTTFYFDGSRISHHTFSNL